MDLFHRNNGRVTALRLCRAALGAALATVGCASPGPPKAPSLNLPQPVRDLTVNRIGDTVELHFTAPSRSTDKLPLRGGTVTGQFCRQLEHQACLPVPSSRTTISTTGPKSAHNIVTWTDTLPTNLVQAPPRLLGYRVEFFSPAGRSAGTSPPAFTATGQPPDSVGNLRAEGSRLGVVLHWNASSPTGDVLLKRENLAPTNPNPKKNKPSKSTSTTTPNTVWLGTRGPTDGASQSNGALDITAAPGTPYRYSAQRRVIVQLGGHAIELRSAISAPITFILREVYPPPAPTGLTAVGFFANAPSMPTGASSAFAVDLIWQPVNDTGLLAGLAGYKVYREPLDTTGKPTAARAQLNTTPVPSPSFHDTSANPATRYRYSVTAIDAKGNESPAVSMLLEPSTAH